MSASRPALHALAARLGVLPLYRDVDGRDRPTTDETREALVTAMGRAACDEASAARSLEELDEEEAARLVEPVLVWRTWEGGEPRLPLPPRALGGATRYSLELELEEGEVLHGEGALPQGEGERPVLLPLPVRPPTGYHELRLRVEGGGVDRSARQHLVMAPRTAFPPEEALDAPNPRDRGAFGLWANLYSLRGGAGFGHGTLGDLAALARFAGGVGADFVGVNPLHAVSNRGFDFAPYSPTSRIYRNVLYLDPEAVPELPESPAARELLTDPALAARRRALRAADRLDHEAVRELVLPLLRALYDTFESRHPGRATARGAAYARYRQREGDALRDFATFEVLAEQLGAPGPPRNAWWEWPAPLRDPRSAAVASFRAEHAREVELRCWLQFELDRQLGEAARAARQAGCRIGLYQDLALGTSRASADAWMDPGLLASGVSIGAPPDAYAPDGQDWGLPPLDPHRLRAAGYRPWSRLLRAAFAHAGALRLDHAMGLLRLFWIPEQRGPRCPGAYVAYPAHDLLGILALESRRHGAPVVAEDLGTVPPELPGMLEDWGLLRSTVLVFSRDEAGAFLPPGELPARSLASFGTHDMPPFAGYWRGVDLELRRAHGRLPGEGAIEAARAERSAEREALLQRLRAEGLLDEGEELPAAPTLRAVHALLARSPAVLVVASLDDLAGEEEPVNVPGVTLEVHRSWSRRMGRPLEELARAQDVLQALEPLRRRPPRGASSG